MTEKTFKYEDEIAGHMQEFTAKEGSSAFNIVVPGISPQEATATSPAIAGTATKTWSFPKEALGKVFPHGREDMPALCDFIQASWSFSRVPDRLPDTINKPTEEQIKLTAVCKKFSATLLDALGVTQYAQFRELSKAVDQDTTMGAERAAEAQAAKDAKAAEKKAARDAKNAEKKAERDKLKAEKKEAKDKEKAEAKAKKDAEKAEKKEAEKKRIEAARIESVAKKNAEVAANGGKTDSEVEKEAKKGKFTGKTKMSAADKREMARVEEEAKAEQQRIRDEKAKMDAEFEAGEKPATDDVADAILAGDDTQQG